MKALLIMVAVALNAVSFITQAQEMDFPHLSTSGYGEVIATPDMAQFSVKVVEVTMNAEQAKQKVDNVVSAFISRLNEQGVDKGDIVSSNLYLTPQYHYPKNGEPELVGYRAVRNISVEVGDLSKLNQYLDIALEENINQVDDIQLKVHDQEKFQQQARMEAIKDAMQKAEFLAKGFGRELDGVWRIEYNPRQVRPIMMKATAFSEDSSISKTYQDSKITITDSVSVIYKLD